MVFSATGRRAGPPGSEPDKARGPGSRNLNGIWKRVETDSPSYSGVISHKMFFNYFQLFLTIFNYFPLFSTISGSPQLFSRLQFSLFATFGWFCALLGVFFSLFCCAGHCGFFFIT